MIIKPQNQLSASIITKLLRVVNKLDNSGESSLDKNGEGVFIDKFVSQYKTKNPTIFDVGANVGEYSELLVNKFGSSKYNLHLFEPQKNCFSDLENNFSKNEQMNLNNFGLSSSNETATIYKNEDKSGLTSLYKRNLDFYNLKMDVEEKISLKRADEYIESKNIKHIHLLKVDVEGHEISALKGFGKYLNGDFIDYIQLEYGGANLDSHSNLLDYYNLLLPLGFKITKVMPNFLELREYNPRMDNYVYSNYVAISNMLIR